MSPFERNLLESLAERFCWLHPACQEKIAKKCITALQGESWGVWHGAASVLNAHVFEFSSLFNLIQMTSEVSSCKSLSLMLKVAFVKEKRQLVVTWV